MKKLFHKLSLFLIILFVNTSVQAVGLPYDESILSKKGVILPDTIFVGQNEIVSSISNSSTGLFFLINNNVLAKDLIVIVKSDLLMESGSVILNTPNTTGGGTHYIKIIPQDSNTYTIKGNAKYLLQVKNVDSLILGDSQYSRPNLVLLNNCSIANELTSVFTAWADINKTKYNKNLKFFNCKFYSNQEAAFSIGFYVKSILNNLGEQSGKCEDLEFDNCEFENSIGIDLTDVQNSFNGITFSRVKIINSKFFSSIYGTGVNTGFGNAILIKNNKFEVNKLNRINNFNIFLFASFISIEGSCGIDISENIFNCELVQRELDLKMISIQDSKLGYKRIFNNVAQFTISTNSSGVTVFITSNYSEHIDIVNNSCIIKQTNPLTLNTSPQSIIELTSSKAITILNNSFQSNIMYYILSVPVISFNNNKSNDITIQNNHIYNHRGDELIVINNISYSINQFGVNYLLNPFKTIVYELPTQSKTAKSLIGVLANKGIPINYITKDIEGNLRDSLPSIGAYELKPELNDLYLSSIDNPKKTILINQPDSLIIELINNSTKPKTNIAISAKLISTTFTDSSSIHISDTLKAFEKRKVKFLNLGFQNLSTNGRILVNIKDSLDSNLSNDTLEMSYCITNNVLISNPQDDSSGACFQTLSPVFYSKNVNYLPMDWYDAAVGGKHLGRAAYYYSNYNKPETYYATYVNDTNFAGLTTFRTNTSKYKVVMFSLKNTNSFPIYVNKLSFNVSTTSKLNDTYFDVYYKNGTYEGFETNSASWTFYSNKKLAIKSYLGELALGLTGNSGVLVQPGQTISLYISYANNSLQVNDILAEKRSVVSNVIQNGIEYKFGSAKTQTGFSSSYSAFVIPSMNINITKSTNCIFENRVKIVTKPRKTLHDSEILVSSKFLKLGEGTPSNPDTLCNTDTLSIRFKPIANDTNLLKGIVFDSKYVLDLYTGSGLYSKNDDTTKLINVKFTQDSLVDKLVRIRYTISSNLAGNCYINKERFVLVLRTPSVLNLGKDTTLCAGDSIMLTSNLDSSYTPKWSTGDTTRSIVVKNPGIYYLDLEYANCRTIRDSIRIAFKDNIDSLKIQHWFAWCMFQFKPDTFLRNATYYWDFGDNQFSTDSMPFHKYAFDGVYKVKLTVLSHAGNCLKQDTTSIIVNQSCFVGIDHTLNNSIEIYPNPTRGKIYFNGLKGNTTVCLYDIQSKLINVYSINNDEEIDISHLEKGVYILKIEALTKQILKY